TSHVPLVLAQETPARRQPVVDDVEHLRVDAFDQAGSDDRVGAIVDVGERNRVAAAEMQKDAEGSDANATRYGFVAWAIHAPGSNDHVRDSMRPSVLADYLVLAHLREGVGVATSLRMCFDRTGLVQQTPVRLPAVRVDRKRAHADEPSQRCMRQ